MAKTNSRGGQKKTRGSASGQKRRSPTSNPHGASREEPSHVTEKRRSVREKKVKRGS